MDNLEKIEIHLKKNEREDIKKSFDFQDSLEFDDIKNKIAELFSLTDEMKEYMAICIVNSIDEKTEIDKDSFQDQLEDEYNYTDNKLVLSFSINYGKLSETKLILNNKEKKINDLKAKIKELEKEKLEINQKFSKIMDDLYKESENIKRNIENMNNIQDQQNENNIQINAELRDFMEGKINDFVEFIKNQ